MKIVTLLGVAMAAACFAGTASAGTYIVEQSQTRYIACYDKVYVPAKIAVNTRGRLVRPYSQSWEVSGGGCSGGSCEKWAYVRNPPVYIQTRRVVEPDHYTLVAGACK